LSSTNENEGLSRYPLPGVPTPILDADIPNKAYVDAGIGGTFLLDSNPNSFTSVDDRNWTLGPRAGGGTTGSGNRLTIPFPFRITGIMVNVGTNTKPTDTLLNFKEDGVVVASLTITGSTTGPFQRNDLSVTVAINSACEMNIDSTGNGGTLAMFTVYFICTRL